MNDFNMLVLNVAVIVFIITLVVVGIILYFSIQNANFPPFTTQCPTYYTIDASNNCVFDSKTYNNKSIGFKPSMAIPPPASRTECNNVPISYFYNKGFSDEEVLCAKNRWAKDCDVFWDGVTNNSNACYNLSSKLFPSSSANSLPLGL